MAETKVCRVCKAEKPLSEFGIKRQRKDGLNCDCKQCNKERVAAYCAGRGDEWKVHKKAYDRQRIEADLPRFKAEWRERYEANKERHAEYAREWGARNPEKRRLIRQHYKHRRRATEREGISYSALEAWKKAQPKKCYWCGVDCKTAYVVDHYVPLARGGKHVESNLVIACRPCNAKKSARDPLVFAREVGRLF